MDYLLLIALLASGFFAARWHTACKDNKSMLQSLIRTKQKVRELDNELYLLRCKYNGIKYKLSKYERTERTAEGNKPVERRS